MASWAFRQLSALQGQALIPGRARRGLLQAMGMSVHPTAFVAERVHFGGHQVSLAEGAFVNVDVYLEGNAPITIGKHVLIGSGCRLLTSSHELGSDKRRAGHDTRGAIVIGEGTWIGAGVLVLPGVTIAPGCMIAAGAVLTNSTDPNGLYGGVPAKRLRTLT